MSKGGFLGINLSQHVDEMRSNRVRKGRKGIRASASNYSYLTGIVSEFISEPDEYLSLFENIKTEKPVVNGDDYELMVKNCVVAYIIDESESNNGGPPVICYPFFPHMSLPVKTGEHVWILLEENSGRDVYYWLSRKTGYRHTEDVNYTHAERFEIIDEKLREDDPDTVSKKSGVGGNLFGAETADIDEEDMVSFDMINKSLPDGYSISRLMSESVSYNEDFTPEPVPPVRKKQGDTLINGSNNTIIHMTTEKFSKPAGATVGTEVLLEDPPSYAPPPITAETNFGVPSVVVSEKRRSPLSPAIDICVGRKKNELNSLKSTSGDTSSSGNVSIIKNNHFKSYEHLGSYEINKVEKIFNKNSTSLADVSLDEDPKNCGARVYLSNSCDIDKIFNSDFDVLSSHGGPSLATYAQVNRVISDGSLRLANTLGESFLDMDPIGNIVMKSSKGGGQQYVSLGKNGITRINAKSTGEIHFAVRDSNDAPDEPYILYSELRTLLADMCADIAGINAHLEALIPLKESIEKIPGFGTVISSIDTLIGASGATKTFAEDARINVATLPVELSPAGRLGKNEELNGVSQRGTIASTKIFGESND